MAYVWLGERMGEEHRRDLAVARLEHRKAQPGELSIGASLHTVEQIHPHHQPELEANPQPKVYVWPGDGRRHFTHHVGSLLIRAGTRLGGASISTS